MFSGIVECLGKIKIFTLTGSSSFSSGASIYVLTNDEFAVGLEIGGSVAVNGVCLTIKEFQQNGFGAEVAPETIIKSNIKDLKSGNLVNLEKPLKLSTPLDGHLVLGHVDTTGNVVSISADGIAERFVFSCSQEILDYLVPKGSVAVNGISLTIAELNSTGFSVSVISHTLNSTNLQFLSKGDRVNLEGDVIGKYVVNFLKRGNFSNSKSLQKSSLSMESLQKAGFINPLRS